MARLLLPLSAGKKKRLAKIKRLRAAADQINSKPNSIAHQGKFSEQDEAEAAIQQTREFIETLVRLYALGFALKDQKKKG